MALFKRIWEFLKYMTLEDGSLQCLQGWTHCCACAGRVLYDWRVFPIRLDEAPVAALGQQDEAHAAGSAGAARLLGESRQAMAVKHSADAQQGQAMEAREGMVRKEAEPQQPAPQRILSSGRAGGEENCTAWPADAGLPEGPAVYR